MAEYKLGRLAGLSLSARPSALAGTLLLLAILGAVGAGPLGLPFATALVAGVAAVALHWGSEFLHPFGHAGAARRAGAQMIGVRAGGVLRASVYPPDEPALPGRIHIRRALGGPL